ncbi:MAG TPA: glutamine--fructose-6-phosphate aminotransferase, partial [Nitrospira sp.]
MCGIIGYVGDQDAVPILIGGLAKLEYRGYDSSGVAVMQGEKIAVRRSVGKLVNLQHSLKANELKGMVGIGHTRWATHGKPSEQNAHPHRSKGCVLVHNGIIENYQELKR